MVAGTRRPVGRCAGDLLAFGALRAITPGGLVAVGCDDIDLAAVAAVPLTFAWEHVRHHVVSRPELVAGEGQRAVRLLEAAHDEWLVAVFTVGVPDQALLRQLLPVAVLLAPVPAPGARAVVDVQSSHGFSLPSSHVVPASLSVSTSLWPTSLCLSATLDSTKFRDLMFGL